jgi:hypothetical protein
LLASSSPAAVAAASTTRSTLPADDSREGLRSCFTRAAPTGRDTNLQSQAIHRR